MKYSVLCENLSAADFVYDILVSKDDGPGCLCGLDEHIMVDDVMVFELTAEEAEEASKLPGVIRVAPQIGTAEACAVTITTQQGRVKAANTGETATDYVPHSLHYHANFELEYMQNGVANGSQVTTLSSIDCSNIDFIVTDSGIDPTHPDFLDKNNNSRVVQFDWSQLRESPSTNNTYSQTAPKILNSLPANYYSDVNGHGTAVASLAAGNRCGFAKNAKIYALKCIDVTPAEGGISLEASMKFLLSFLRAKKQNLYGLSSSRPTISVNSWGMFVPALLPGANAATREFCRTCGNGANQGTKLTTPDDGVDSYVRACIAEGCHYLVASGNANQYLENSTTLITSALNYQRVSDSVNFTVLNDSGTNALAINQNVTVDGVQYKVAWRTTPFYYTHNSPSPGIGVSRDTYPSITVGDVLPIGNNNFSTVFGGPATSMAVYNLFQRETDSAAKTVLAPININNVRYKTSKEPFFIKSPYSNFGRSVEVYACGNATWTALSNQKNAANVSVKFERSSTEKYQYFNGTSAACPVVAGILGTYLAEFPTASPKSAKEWLIQTGVKGNIAETRKTTHTVNTINFNTKTATPITAAYGPSAPANISDNPHSRLGIAINVSFYGQGDKATLEDFSFLCRFFDTNNVMPQAHPLRKGVFDTASNTFNRFNTTLRLSADTPVPKTHDYPLF
jgi:subtilisin family serine protease